MLRFTPTLEIALRKKESWVSSDFWRALGLAFIFHALLFSIFHIAALPNPDRVKPLSPIDVEIDLGARALPDVNAEVCDFPIETSSPQILPPFFFHIDVTPFLHKLETYDPDFSQIEGMDYEILEETLEGEMP